MKNIYSSKLLHFLIGLFLFALAWSVEINNIEIKALGMVALMVYWWITEPIPIYMTALVPLILGQPLHLISKLELAEAYGNNMIFLFFGGFVLALAIEKRNLHRVFANYIIHTFGQTPTRLLLSFMLTTAFLSMWISNTATALMMLPMGLAVLSEIPRSVGKKKYEAALMLGIAFSANIGGTATLVGTPPNIQMAAILNQDLGIHINFFEWLWRGFPFMIILLFISFLLLKIIFLKKVAFKISTRKAESLNANQKRVLLIFCLTAFLWITGSYLNSYLPFEINDTITALFGALLCFIIPTSEKKDRLLVWDDTKKLPWGILFLFGGGIALATILSNGNVIEELVVLLKTLNFMPLFVLLFVIFLFVIFTTELMSNLALVSLVVPIMVQFAVNVEISPIALSAGIALCSSCAFMLPIATPPNAIVYSSKRLKVKTMIQIGWILNLITSFLVTTLVYWWIQ